MEGRNTGKMEVDEASWRSLLEVAAEKGAFTPAQVRNINAWLSYDWSTIINSRVCLLTSPTKILFCSGLTRKHSFEAKNDRQVVRRCSYAITPC